MVLYFPKRKSELNISKPLEPCNPAFDVLKKMIHLMLRTLHLCRVSASHLSKTCFSPPPQKYFLRLNGFVQHS